MDRVVACGEPTLQGLIRAICPDRFLKGGDYQPETLPERAVVEQLGGVVESVPLVPERSTGEIIARIRTGVDPAAAARTRAVGSSG